MTAPQSESTIETRLVFEGKILNLRVDTVRMPNGRLAIREIAEHAQSVCLVPIHDNGNVMLVRQYRKATEAALLEVPAGVMEEGESPEGAALRELQEEIGFTAGKLQHLTSSWIAPGWCTELMHVYLATELTPSSLSADEDENITVVPVPLAQVVGLMESGEIQDLKSIAALLLALRQVE